jgi:DNA-directed RNA polymerase omega subunit
MIDPPIDKLIEKTGCKYTLVCMLAKRARILADKRPNLSEETGMKPISFAADEVYDEKVYAQEE